MMDTIKAWQCIGCGKLEAPQNCIGVCQDRRVELVYAWEYAALAAQLARLQLRRDALHALVQRVAALERLDAAALTALRDAAQRLLAKAECHDAMEGRPWASASPPLQPASATSPDASRSLRDRRTAADGQKPRLTQPATLVVR
jgi:hypothetical protein